MNLIFHSQAKSKTAVANIFFTKNLKGLITKNGKTIMDAFSYQIITFPLTILHQYTSAKFAIDIFVKGGGNIAQIMAISKGISKFVYFLYPQSKLKLISLFKDFSNIKFKERKKFGFLKARKKTQYSKR